MEVLANNRKHSWLKYGVAAARSQLVVIAAATASASAAGAPLGAAAGVIAAAARAASREAGQFRPARDWRFEARRPEAGESWNGASAVGSGVVGGGRGRLGPRAFAGGGGLRGQPRRGLRGRAEVVVHQRERHPRILSTTAVNGAPGGEGGQGVLGGSVVAAGQQVAGWNHAAVVTAAQPPED